MLFSLYVLFAILPLLNLSLAKPKHGSLHPKLVHSIPAHRRSHLDFEVEKRNLNTASKKAMVRTKKRSNCQVPAVVSSSTSLTENTTSSTALSVQGDLAKTSVSSNVPAQTSTTSFKSSTTTSAVVETSSTASSSSSGNSTGSLLDMLFPVGQGSADWTTSTDASDALSFTSALKPLTAGKLPSIGNSPDGQSSLIANYPAGTFQYSASTGAGFSFYTEGATNGVLVEGASEVLFSYSVYFQEGFQFVKGGKLPGLYGGTSLAEAKSCSGGRQDDRDECFSARLMWRTNGAGELYNYYPSAVYNDAGYCTTAPYSICDTTYGDSIGRGSFTFPTGEWITLSQRLKLNDVGSANGEQELFVNGVSTISLTGLEISVESDTKIYGIMAQTFFGGNDATWASPIDQSAYFKDWSLAVLA